LAHAFADADVVEAVFFGLPQADSDTATSTARLRPTIRGLRSKEHNLHRAAAESWSLSGAGVARRWRGGGGGAGAD
jgi:hypothetical protein